ncbi:MAG TPA: S9 family peptidase [Candidatus Solibacter sp.]|nr:S9 family peptidase [Candidatus Solibacter sp.]
MFRTHKLYFAIVLLSASLALGQSATKRTLRVDDMHRFQDVRDVQISPEGKWVAYTLNSVDTTADKSDSDVWMVSWDGSQQVRLTSSPENETAPRWSPDGHYLSFLSGRKGKTKGTQVWLLDRMGGEAQQLTDVKGRISSYSWSPDSKQLLLVMTERDPNEPDDDASGPGPTATPSAPPSASPAPGASPSPTPSKAPKPIVIDRYHFKQDEFGYLTQKPARLVLFDIATKKTEMLTAETLEASSPTWSPNGRSIAFLGKEGKDAERYNTWNVFVIDARAGATPRPLTHYDGVHSSASRAQAEWSPDGTRLVYLQSSGAKQDAYNMNRLAVVPVAGGGEPKILTSDFDRGVSAPRFSPDGFSIVFLVADDRSQYLARVASSGGAIERMVKTPGVVSTLAQGKDGRLALLASNDNTVPEVQALENGALRPLTHHNDALLAEFKLGTTEEFSCKAKDGNEVHGLIVKPPDYEASKKYPTLLRIHGGPNGQDQHSFSFERQIFAANGYVVVAVNYRGSSGRGEKYQTAIASDWGNKEVVDLQAAVDYVLSIGIADPDHLGVGGWSYGGILTDAIIAKDHRFKAATSGAGTAFPIALYGVDQYIIQYDEEIGAPWKVGLEPWIKISYPFLHADQITTPTLFMGGEKDFNVPLVGGEQMYQALSSLGVPTQLVVYPGEKHGIMRPSYQKDRIDRYLGWYGKYLKPAGAPAATTSGH